MIKKGCLFSLVVFCSLFFLTACQKPQGSSEVGLVTFKEQKMPFDALMETGFVPPVIRLPDSYVNDKIESKAKKLSYEFYYYKLNGSDDFADVKEEKLFSPSYIIHTATIAEEDAGDASKTKIKYDKLKGANGGDVCVGTKFVLGLRIKDQVGELRYRAILQYIVQAPSGGALADGSMKMSVPGNQTGFVGEITPTEGTIGAVEFKDGRTVYSITGATAGHTVALKFGTFGSTNAVVIK